MLETCLRNTIAHNLHELVVARGKLKLDRQVYNEKG